MTILGTAQALQIAKNAGFVGEAQIRIVAIGIAESNLNTDAVGFVGNGFSVDRGWLQINNMAHPEVSDGCAYDAQCAANAAYRISKSGTDFTAWTTLAKSNQYMAQVRAFTIPLPAGFGNQFGSGSGTSGGSSGGSGGSGGSTIAAPPIINGQKAWYTFPRIDNLGGVEPFGGFPKPDSNIQIPTDYPVTALLPGTVTALDGGEVGWGSVVTIKLDVPQSNLATHTAYLHLSKYVVSVGQHVSAGQLIGYNGLAHATGFQKVPLGFAFYNGDHYGFGSAWSLMTKANLTNGGPLDPVPLLNAAAKGSLNIPPYTGTSDTGFVSNTPVTNIMASIQTVQSKAYQTINNIPGFLGICEALDVAETFVPFQFTSVQQDASQANQSTTFDIWGFNTNIPNPWAIANKAQGIVNLPSDAMQALLIFTTTNFMAFAVRSLFVICGVILFWSLMINLVSKVISPQDVGEAAKAVMAIAA